MSLVQAVVCDQFVFVAGEQQLNLSSGGVLHNFRKIFKLNFMNSKLIRKKYNFKN